jgi:hypothetical protein
VHSPVADRPGRQAVGTASRQGHAEETIPGRALPLTYGTTSWQHAAM